MFNCLSKGRMHRSRWGILTLMLALWVSAPGVSRANQDHGSDTVFILTSLKNKIIMFFFPDNIRRRYYGHQRIEISQPFITTRWWTLLFFPVWPLASYRMVVRQNPPQWVSVKKSYQVYYYRLKRLPLNWFQVFRVYLMTFLNIALAIVIIRVLLNNFF